MDTNILPEVQRVADPVSFLENNVILFVPEWIATTAKRHNITLNELLSPDRFYSAVSYDDQISLFSCNNIFNKFLENNLGEDRLLDDTIKNSRVEFILHGPSNHYLRNKVMSDERSKHGTQDVDDSVLTLSMSDDYIEKMYHRLFSISACTIKDGESIDPQVINLDDKSVALVISPGQVTFSNSRLVNRLDAISHDSVHFLIRALEECLKQFYIYHPQHVVQSTIWYRYYVRLLAFQSAIPF